MAIAKSIRLCLAAAAALAAALAPSLVRADMGLAPLREVLTAEHRSAEFTVSNPSDHIMEGNVSWIDLAASPEGYDPATPELRAALSAAPYLLLSPAAFRLEPGARQIIRVRIKDGARLPAGERRSHLLIETKAVRSPIRKTGGGLQVDVGLGVSAPVILRNGGQAKAKIGDTRLLRDDDGMLMLATRIHPQGDVSTYGRIAVSFTDAASGETAVLGVVDNIAGYTDAIERAVTVPFGFVALGAGELRIRYEGAAEYDGVLFDQRAYDIAPPSD